MLGVAPGKPKTVRAETGGVSMWTIEIAIGEIQLIERREVVRNVQISAGDGKFKETVSITADGRVKSAVAGNKINVAVSVGGRRTAALPDAAQAAIWSCIEDALSLE